MFLSTVATGEAVAEEKISRPRGGKRPGAGRPSRATKFLPLGPRWYVAQITRRKAVAALRDGESRPGLPFRPPFVVESPQLSIRQIRCNRAIAVRVPMLRGYCFVLFDREVDAWPTIAGCPGVRRLLGSAAGVPTPLPTGTVDRLLKQADEYSRGELKKLARYEVGQELLVLEGPMAGFHATCVECDGLLTTAALWIFGSRTAVTLPRSIFGPVTGDPAAV